MTLLEVLVVLVILALAAALVPILAPGLGGVRARAGTDEIVSLLRDARALAIARGQAVEIPIDPARGTWRLPGHTVFEQLGPGVTRVETVPADMAGEDGMVRLWFLADGSAPSGLRMRVHHGERVHVLAVEPMSGRVLRAP